MSSLNPAQFDEFFHALYGCDPFPWQARLARRVAAAPGGDAAWPEALAPADGGGQDRLHRHGGLCPGLSG